MLRQNLESALKDFEVFHERTNDLLWHAVSEEVADTLCGIACGPRLWPGLDPDEDDVDIPLGKQPDDFRFIRKVLRRYPSALRDFCGRLSMLNYASEKEFVRLARLAISESTPTPDELQTAVNHAVSCKIWTQQEGRVAVLSLLRDVGANFTPETLVVSVQALVNEEVVQHLVTFIDPNQPPVTGMMPLHAAVASGTTQKCRNFARGRNGPQ